MVRTVTTNEEGKATGVSFIDKEDNTEYKLKEKLLFLLLQLVALPEFYLIQNQNNIQTV